MDVKSEIVIWMAKTIAKFCLEPKILPQKLMKLGDFAENVYF